MLRLALAWVHLVALGVGLGAVWARAGALGARPLDAAAARRAFAADTWWGAAALLWIASGLWRLLAGTEKATGYYLQNHVFYAKMALLLLVVVLEAWPAATLVRWRRAAAAGARGAAWQPDAPTAARIRAVSYVEAALVLGMAAAAAAMARGYGLRA
jgi:putative membrane protein